MRLATVSAHVDPAPATPTCTSLSWRVFFSTKVREISVITTFTLGTVPRFLSLQCLQNVTWLTDMANVAALVNHIWMNPFHLYFRARNVVANSKRAANNLAWHTTKSASRPTAHYLNMLTTVACLRYLPCADNWRNVSLAVMPLQSFIPRRPAH